MPKLGRTIAALATPVLAAGGATPALAAGTPAHGHDDAAKPAATPDTPHYVTWENGHAAEYLHVKGASKDNSAAVNVYTGSGTCAEHGAKNLQCPEEWQQISTGYAHWFAYMNVNANGKCLDDPEDELADAVIYSCGNYPVQRRWRYSVVSPLGFAGVLYDKVVQGDGNSHGYLCQNSPAFPAGSRNDVIVQGWSEMDTFNVGGACSWK
jgi:hypothetical protein